MSIIDTTAAPAAVNIDKIASETLRIPIVGTSPLIVHRFSEKAKRQMLDAMQGKKKVKTIRDPQADYEEAFYRWHDDATGESGYGFPTIAFKAATVSAARLYDKSVAMTQLRQQLFFRGILGDDGQQVAVIEGEPTMREDVVRLGMSSTDLRYRPTFNSWRTVLEVTYIASSISRASVLSLIDAGGLTVGVGEWRPEKRGDFGTFAIDQSRQIEVVG